MLFKLKIQLRKALLGAKDAEEGTDSCIFDRDHQDNLMLALEFWYGALHEAFKQL